MTGQRASALREQPGHREAALSELVTEPVARPDGSDGAAADALAGATGAPGYLSRFDAWHDRASIRVKPHRVLTPGEAIYFSPELAPWATHPLVTERGEQAVRRVLIRRLFDYLHFTTELEQLAVIPIATRIARGRSGLELPAAMQADAFKIVTDEAWHAQFSFDLLRQVEATTGVSCGSPVLPAFVTRLDQIRASLDPSVRGLESLLFAIVSETLISSILVDLPRDSRLPPAVRELVADHAQDEGRHHSYFWSLLQHLWPQLSTDQRAAVGPQLPAIIQAFLLPDAHAIRDELRELRLSQDELDEVAGASIAAVVDRGDIAVAAKAAVRYFSEVGAIGDSRTRDAFVAAGLVLDG
ncbi:MAG: diiron oxygenase [Jatrophihabitans sp.]